MQNSLKTLLIKPVLILVLTLVLNSCQVRSPLTGLNYDITPYKYGLKIDSDIIGFRIGTITGEKLFKESDYIAKPILKNEVLPKPEFDKQEIFYKKLMKDGSLKYKPG